MLTGLRRIPIYVPPGCREYVLEFVLVVFLDTLLKLYPLQQRKIDGQQTVFSEDLAMPNIDSLRAEISELGLDPMLSEDAFQNEQSQKLFEAIDELRSSGIDGDIDLPEVVYGEDHVCTAKAS